MSDAFRPSHEPARMIYDAFQAEADSRLGRSYKEWVSSERTAVWRVARDYAQQTGLPVPTLKAVAEAEKQALGHTDFGAKWAYAVADLLHPTERSGSDG